MKVLLNLIILGALSTHLIAEVRIQTLDSWKIESYSPDSLMVTKSSESKDNYLAFEMSRPFCICEQLSFVMYEENEFTNKELIEGKLSFNFLRTKNVTYKIEHAQQGLFVLGLKNFPSIRNTEHLSIKSEHFEDEFVITGLSEVMQQSKDMCQSYIEYEYVEPEAEEMSV